MHRLRVSFAGRNKDVEERNVTISFSQSQEKGHSNAWPGTASKYIYNIGDISHICVHMYMYTHMRETNRHKCMHVSAMPHPSDTPGNRGAELNCTVTHPTPDVSPCHLTRNPCLLIRSFYFMAVPSNSGQVERKPHESLRKITSNCILKGSC
jgi:hypothetical protein